MFSRLSQSIKKLAASLAAVLMLAALIPQVAHASSVVLSLTPSTGTFVVDSTFDISIYLDTQGQSVNTIELNLEYPPDKLQLVSSSTGQSIIGIWTSVPQYDNSTGKISLIGGVPGGITVSNGLVTTFTFRARAVGSAIVKFDSSKVLLNDGLGTEVLSQAYNSVYNIVLPPPAGPTVASPSHPDQTRWYDNNNPELTWGSDGAQGYSYILNDTPIDTPDDISEGTNTSVSYHNLSDGRHYFHIKALRNGQWGGVTDFALNVDTSPPADFKVTIIPDARTARTQPVVEFATTDAYSGLDHYELKIVPLSQTAEQDQSQLFIEAQSPYVTSVLPLGDYDVIVRAYDNAGNVREVTQRLTITNFVFSFFGDRGVEFGSTLVLTWFWFWLLIVLILILLGYLAWRTRHWHREIHEKHINPQLPSDINNQLDELKRFRNKYGKIAMVILLLGFSLLAGHKTLAQTSSDQLNQSTQVLSPPVITTVSKNITNNEIFYIGGRTGVPASTAIIYLQNLGTDETTSENVTADKNGEWFYRSDHFLSPGNYVIWSQTKVDAQLSPPSPQISITVESAAIQFGATQLSYSAIYLGLFVIAILILLLLVIYIVYHYRSGRRKHKFMMSQITEAEASVRRGFAVLNRDLQSELDVIKQAKLNQKLSVEEQKREDELVKDLSDIEQYLSKEIWEIKDTEVRN